MKVSQAQQSERAMPPPGWGRDVTRDDPKLLFLTLLYLRCFLLDAPQLCPLNSCLLNIQTDSVWGGEGLFSDGEARVRSQGGFLLLLEPSKTDHYREERSKMAADCWMLVTKQVKT